MHRTLWPANVPTCCNPWPAQRHFLRYTTRGLTGEQAAQQTTASELSLGGLIKHVALTEQQWMRFIVDGPSAMSWDEASAGDWMAGFKMLDGETLAGLLVHLIVRISRHGTPYAWAFLPVSWHAIFPFGLSTSGQPSDPEIAPLISAR